jgi:hypothetical protein
MPKMPGRGKNERRCLASSGLGKMRSQARTALQCAEALVTCSTCTVHLTVTLHEPHTSNLAQKRFKTLNLLTFGLQPCDPF